MKKLTIFLAIFITILCINKEENVTIPKEAIRFRVIANSNKEEDQMLKKKLVTNLKGDIKRLEFRPQNISDSRNKIKSQIPNFKKVIEKTLSEEKYPQKYSINYGMNYFPEKTYKGITYAAGEYESLVIKLGDGFGENFWCILFPPLCLLDAEEEDINDVEYTSLVKEILDKYF